MTTALLIFLVFVSITLVITYWAARRSSGANAFFAANRQITAWQNGFAVAGDYMSAASFLGIAGIIAFQGYDGFMYSVGWLVAYLTVLLIVAEPLRNAGKYTMADVLAYRLSPRPVRAMASLSTLTVSIFYMIAQMVGAGALVALLLKDSGISYQTAVIGVGADPGMSNVICRAVADELDDIDRINLYWAAEFVGQENPILCPPYNIATVLAEYAHSSTQFLEGKHVECGPREGREFLDLPQPWGHCEFFYSPHSEPLTVPLAEGFKEKNIREFTWKLHLPHREHEAWVGLVKAGFSDFSDPLIAKGVAITPLEFLSELIARNIERNRDRIPSQESHEIHLAIGRGTRRGLPVTVRCEVIVRPNEMYKPYVDACTSMNASIAAQLILAGPLRPGVFAPESYFDVPSYFRELRRREFSVRTVVGE